jgi:hypothetical protein|uniref:Uncharacterized protein n=1 Tax=viral metagenome TaxID=1070528 RepID=A0A6C0DFL9_9ZZZZ
METISSKIILLPKEIQDIISEYNVEHRPMMERVFQVIRSLDLKCYICDAYLYDKPIDDVVYIMKRVFVCSKNCENIAHEELKNVP